MKISVLFLAYAITRTQISRCVTAHLISAFVSKSVISRLSLSSVAVYSPVCVGPGRKPRRQVFWQCASYTNT